MSPVHASKLLTIATPPRSSAFPALPAFLCENRSSPETDVLENKLWQDFREWKPEASPSGSRRSEASLPPAAAPAQASRASFVAMTPPWGAWPAWSPAPGSPTRTSKALAMSPPSASVAQSSSSVQPSVSQGGRGSRRSLVAEDLPDTLWQDFRAWAHAEH